VIPGKIESEAYTTMSGIAKEATSDTGGGENIGYIDAGDWMDYAVNVQTTGNYSVTFRTAGWSASAQLQLRPGSTVLATVNVPNTGGGQIWTTTSAVTVPLTAGSQTLRVHVMNGGFNLNWMNFATSGGNIFPTASITSPANNATITGLGAVAIDAAAADTDGTISKVEFHVNGVLHSTDTSSPYGATWTPAATGNYVLTAKAFDNQNASTTSTAVNVTVVNGQPGSAIPGKIEAESYTTMSGVAKEGTADVGGGENVGYIDGGDWMDYAVTVQAAGTYAVTFRLAGWNTAAQLQLKNGSTTLAAINVPNTGGGQIWTTTSPVNITLPAGNTTLRVVVITGGFNFNWMNFASGGARLAVNEHREETIHGYPNPSENAYSITGVPDGTEIKVSDMTGRIVLTTKLKNGSVNITSLLPGAYLVYIQETKNLNILRLTKQ
jgi:hypothetical protein